MNVAIIGYARDGKVGYEYYTKRGDTVTICDQNPNLEVPPGALTQLGDNYLNNLDRFDVIVRTSGMKPYVLSDASPGIEPKITSAVDEFLRACPTKNTIGVTGTKGKGTTCTLIVKILEAAGKKVWFGGNVGWSPLEFIDQIQPDDWVVLELSSFQLSDIKHTTHIGVCLMVVPEHLDWHQDLDEYFLAKSRLFELQTPKDIAIYYYGSSESREIAAYSPGIKMPYFREPGAHITNGNVIVDDKIICATSEIKLLGEFNWQNVCAAVTAVWQVTQDVGALKQVITSFAGLEHHLELVATIDGVSYYNDSFGTIPETAIVAIKAFEQPKVLILGGSVKGSAYEDLAKKVAESNVRKVILIGNTASPDHACASPQIAEALKNAGYDDIISLVRGDNLSMLDIVTTAQEHAQPGDAVLLSTGCASFDMFVDYKDRGNQFKQAVQALAATAPPPPAPAG